ncbi:signal peptidase I [Homoserinibacter sp. YIM 151385]|uniref:signal peptidase I n=1 Tax=Homoserinibacter sp. YIM 151385 TaxID=2985506 RepID=UPI0022EFE05F|nr:signal peptidase I [Homoserinibacter sp. YIM 151385]WBU39144.1 signal peptidase I [Homoserinibacter sp. YIM 151385]
MSPRRRHEPIETPAVDPDLSSRAPEREDAAAPAASEDALDASPEPAPADPAKRERGILSYLGISLSAALLLLVVALAAIVIVIPKVAGGMPLTVLTNSMEPDLPPGTLLVVRPVDFDDIEVGDVITYQVRSGDPTVITHRVIGFTSSSDGEPRLVLQGDNNAVPDPDPVRPIQVQAELWYSIPLLGWVNSAVNGEQRPWFVGIAAGLLFSYTGWMVITAVRDGSRRRRERATAAEQQAGHDT